MNFTTDTLLSSPVEQEVSRLQQLRKDGRNVEALAGSQVLLESVPENRDLLLVAAASLRCLSRLDEALAIIDRLEKLHPRFSQLHQERGLCYVALKDAPRAIGALLQAVNINPALPMSWRMLEGVYRLTGDTANAATAAAHVATLHQLPREVVTATSRFSDGEFTLAEHVIRPYLLRGGNHPEAMRLLAKIGIARDVLDDAETLLEAVLTVSPDHRAARYEYANTLVKRQKYALAQKEAHSLLAMDPRNYDYRSLAAIISIGLGEHHEAIHLYRSMLADVPDSPDVNLWLGHVLKTIGKLPEAIAAYRSAAAARPDFGDAYWSLANLKTYRFDDAEVACMRESEAASDTAIVDRYHLCFALGKALEDKKEIEPSWRYYSLGNALKCSESRYQPEILEANTANQIAVCSRNFFEQRKGWGDLRHDPVFILGLPRAGSTLLEQILASHSQVEGTHELVDIQRLVLILQGRDHDLTNPRYPGVMAEMTQDDFRRLGETYLFDTRIYRTGKTFFIDKMPNNFRHIGFIQLILPNARIIDARREPLSCCFSNFKQLFANGQEFTYKIENIARYYRTYLELMRHWDSVLPGRVLRVHYEDVIDDLENSVRRILDYCGLPFEATCVSFHKTQRSVRTPSSEQVRQPIFRDGLDQWKIYERWLEPLKEALGDALIRYRD